MSAKKLSAALPECRIESDFGVFGPTAVADPDRRAAEWVLSMGGQNQFDSDYFRILLSVAVPIGGAVASLVCTSLVERFGSTKGLAEEPA